MCPWKAPAESQEKKAPAKLQFGHGSVPVESPQSRSIFSKYRRLQFGHGSVPVESSLLGRALALPAHSLQFGHGSVPVERERDSLIEARVLKLQFGHGSVPVESTATPRPERASGQASIRPRQCARGKHNRHVRLVWDHRCFNSATAVCPWKGGGTGDGGDKAARASIRPRQCARGKVCGDRVSRHVIHASIRPRQCARGKPRPSPASGAAPWGFNSATAVCPWKGGRHHPPPVRLAASIRPRQCARGKPTPANATV